jgi:anti-anti-sigma factor
MASANRSTRTGDHVIISVPSAKGLVLRPEPDNLAPVSSPGVVDEHLARRSGHLCWIADEDRSFLDGAVAFLAEGLRRNERLMLVADETLWAPVEERLGGLGFDPVAIRAEGAILLRTPECAYGPGPLDIERQIRTYEVLVDGALRDGYAGLRLAADLTSLVPTESARRQFVAHELAVDRFIAGAPMTAFCSYDHRGLGAAVRELCAVHPTRQGSPATDPAFKLFYGAGRLCLTGEIDIANHSVLVVALDAAVASTEPDVSIDIGSLRFIDVGGLDVVRDTADRLREAGRTLRLVNPSAVVRRSCEILGYSALAGPRVERKSA